jgi:hypothetical protein
MVLASHNRAMTERAADIGDDSGRQSKERGPATEINSQEAGTPFERQGRGRSELAFTLPDGTPLSYGYMIITHRTPTVKRISSCL